MKIFSTIILQLYFFILILSSCVSTKSYDIKDWTYPRIYYSEKSFLIENDAELFGYYLIFYNDSMVSFTHSDLTKKEVKRNLSNLYFKKIKFEVETEDQILFTNKYSSSTDEFGIKISGKKEVLLIWNTYNSKNELLKSCDQIFYLIK